MKRHLAALLLCLLIANLALAQAPAAAPASDAAVRQILVDRIDTYKKSVGIVVGLIGPEGTRVVSYGKLARDGAVPDRDTVFEIGSATKVFTSLLLADMVQRGEVKLDDPVSKFLPATVKIPERNGRKITLLDLATQSSGLPRMPNNFAPKDPSNPYADYTVAQMYEFLSGYELTRDPGSKYDYSNLGVGLLGHALALRAGTDYETAVRKRILEPLKMTSTAITLTPALKARLAHGHNEALQPVSNWDIPTLAGAGALRSTVNDMLLFLAAELGSRATPLSAAMKSMLAVRKPTGAPNLEIALGWHILSKDGSEMVWHNGGTGGYHSFVGFDPKRGTGVVVLSNATADIDDIGRHLLDARYELAKLTVPREHKEIKVDPKIWEAYVGNYQLIPQVTMAITREADALYVQVTGQSRFQLFPESETDYFLKVLDAQVTFVKDDQGKVTQLILHQGGRDTPARRMD